MSSTYNSDTALILAALVPVNLGLAVLTAMLLFEYFMDKLNGPDDPDGFA